MEVLEKSCRGYVGEAGNPLHGLSSAACQVRAAKQRPGESMAG